MTTKHIFLYRRRIEDRDACAYINDMEPAQRFECGHYFGRINITGACYLCGLSLPYSEIETILTEEEYNKLIECDNAIQALGYGIEKGDERYNKGLQICAELQPIIERLKSDEAQQFFASIVESEKKYVQDTYNVSEEDVNDIFNNYTEDYQDRGIIGTIYEDTEEIGREYAENCYDIPDNLENYFDFDKFGADIMSDGNFLELSDGRIVEYNY